MKGDIYDNKLTGYQIIGGLFSAVLVMVMLAYSLKYDSEKLRAMRDAEIKVSNNRCLVKTVSGEVLLAKPCDQILEALNSKS